MVSPVVGRREYLGKLELDKWTLPYAVKILANFSPIEDPSAPELSEVTTYTFRVIGGVHPAAPSGGRARSRYPALQQYDVKTYQEVSTVGFNF